ncbi:MAG: 3-hydroxylacyl-ACP dehydratase [Proteobacteria bacterium SW_6_67_9]|nr:MAG: 3-hydroxylacyl-ACP dehydratase [Proteobacteria bacterium SW_6_67_9]
MRMNGAEIEARIPHAGAMCLLEHADGWDGSGIRCRSASHRDAANPLRRNGRLHAVQLVEYAAQAAALHDYLIANPDSGDSSGKGGMLVEVREVSLGVDDAATIGAELTIEATAELRAAGGLIYRFRICAADDELVTGRLTIATPA